MSGIKSKGRIKQVNETVEQIKVSVAEDRCFFHVLGDERRYFDLDNLEKHHPELKEYCQQNHAKLESELLKQKELMGFHDKY